MSLSCIKDQSFNRRWLKSENLYDITEKSSTFVTSHKN